MTVTSTLGDAMIAVEEMTTLMSAESVTVRAFLKDFVTVTDKFLINVVSAVVQE